MAPSFPPSVRHILGSLDAAVFVPHGNGRFALKSSAPTWLRTLWMPEDGREADLAAPLLLADRFLFLHSFLHDARALWEGTTDGAEMVPGLRGIRSTRWSETDTAGNEWFLEALALRFDAEPSDAERPVAGRPGASSRAAQGSNVLVLHPASIDLSEHRRVLQEGRSLNLEFQHAQRALHQSEVTLECLLHEVAKPLANLRDAIGLLSDESGISDDERASILALAQSQIQELDDALQDTMASPHMGRKAEAASGEPANLRDVARDALQSLSQQATVRQVRWAFDPPDTHGPYVVASQGQLHRLVRSMLVHGLGRSPEGSTVHVDLRREKRMASLAVRDAGPPIPQHVVPYLFERFGPNDPAYVDGSQDLYFCRVAAEALGGSVGYHTEDGVPVVWMCLPRAEGYDATAPL